VQRGGILLRRRRGARLGPTLLLTATTGNAGRLQWLCSGNQPGLDVTILITRPHAHQRRRAPARAELSVSRKWTWRHGSYWRSRRFVAAHPAYSASRIRCEVSFGSLSNPSLAFWSALYERSDTLRLFGVAAQRIFGWIKAPDPRPGYDALSNPLEPGWKAGVLRQATFTAGRHSKNSRRAVRSRWWASNCWTRAGSFRGSQWWTQQAGRPTTAASANLERPWLAGCQPQTPSRARFLSPERSGVRRWSRHALVDPEGRR